MRSFLLKISFAILLLSGITASAQFTGKPQYVIKTYRAGVAIGDIKIELFPLIAPKQTRNFDSLANMHFFDSTAFHRVVPGFVIQGGDPNSRHGARSTWGNGDPSQHNVPAEFSAVKHLRGIVSAARDNDINSANSQFFICVATAANLDGQYSAYGRVVSGMDIADNIVASPRDANDGPLQKIEMFVTYSGSNDSVPDAPVLIAPVNALSNATQGLTLKWSRVNDAVLYQVELSKDSAFATIYLRKSVADTSTAITGLDGLTKYYWRVKANNGGHLSGISTVRSFSSASGTAILLSPADSSLTEPLTINFSWDPVPGATSYRLEINKLSASFPQSATFYNQANINTTSQQVNGFKQNARYYWRVRSAKDTVEGFYSSTRYFRTNMPTAINNEINTGFLLEQNVPNPATGQVSIAFELPVACAVSLKLYDITGKEIRNLINEQKQAGKYVHLLNTDKLPAGTYFYRLQAGENTLVRKMIVN